MPADMQIPIGVWMMQAVPKVDSLPFLHETHFYKTATLLAASCMHQALTYRIMFFLARTWPDIFAGAGMAVWEAITRLVVGLREFASGRFLVSPFQVTAVGSLSKQANPSMATGLPIRAILQTGLPQMLSEELTTLTPRQGPFVTLRRL